jgi:hypothetical protein
VEAHGPREDSIETTHPVHPVPSVAPLPDMYLSLKQLAAYSGLSPRTLRYQINAVTDPLPAVRPGGANGKLLVRRSVYDLWAARRAYVPDLTRLVEAALSPAVIPGRRGGPRKRPAPA